MNLMQIQDELQNIPNTPEGMRLLMQYANGSNPAVVPEYVALGELNRRRQFENVAKQVAASIPNVTIKDQLTKAPPMVDPTAGIAGVNPASPAIPVSPMMSADNPMAAQERPYGGREVRMADGGITAIPAYLAARPGVSSIPLNNMFNPSSYAGGGIVAFSEGDQVKDPGVKLDKNDAPTVRELMEIIGSDREKFEKLASGEPFNPKDFTPKELQAAQLLFSANRTKDPERYLESLNPFHDSQLDYRLRNTNLGGFVSRSEPNTAVIRRLADSESIVPHELTHTLQLRDAARGNTINRDLYPYIERLSPETKEKIFGTAPNRFDNPREVYANLNDYAMRRNAEGEDFVNSPEGRELLLDRRAQGRYYANTMPGIPSIYGYREDKGEGFKRNPRDSYATQLLDYLKYKKDNFAGGGVVAFENNEDQPVREDMPANNTSSAQVPRGGLGVATPLERPAILTDDELIARDAAMRQKFGIAEDPYAAVKAKQLENEARNQEKYAQDPWDRIFTQMRSFSMADPTKGVGYQLGVSGEASAALNKEQTAYRDKMEAASLAFNQAMAKEEDARKRGDMQAVVNARAAQQKAQFDWQDSNIKLENAISSRTQAGAAASQAATAAGRLKLDTDKSPAEIARIEAQTDLYKAQIDAALANVPSKEQNAIKQSLTGDKNYERWAATALSREKGGAGYIPGTPEGDAVTQYLQQYVEARAFEIKNNLPIGSMAPTPPNIVKPSVKEVPGKLWGTNTVDVPGSVTPGNPGGIVPIPVPQGATEKDLVVNKQVYILGNGERAIWNGKKFVVVK